MYTKHKTVLVGPYRFGAVISAALHISIHKWVQQNTNLMPSDHKC